VALVGTLATLGLMPRSVLDLPASTTRGERLLRIIAESRVSIHDLSRQASASGVPRMNMPFEAGLATSLSWGGRPHSVFLLEAERYRLQRTLSDLNGIDPYIHDGTPQGVVRAILEMFRRPGGKRVDITEAERVVARLRIAARAVRARWDGTLFRPGAFRELVATAHGIAAVQRSGVH
jgi:hypothetical protein